MRAEEVNSNVAGDDVVVPDAGSSGSERDDRARPRPLLERPRARPPLRFAAARSDWDAKQVKAVIEKKKNSTSGRKDGAASAKRLRLLRDT